MSTETIQHALAHMQQAVDLGVEVTTAHADACSAFRLSASDARRLLNIWEEQRDPPVARLILSEKLVGSLTILELFGGDDEGYTVRSKRGGDLSRDHGFFGSTAFADALDFMTKQAEELYIRVLG